MKNTSKFLAVMLAITGLFCCAVAVGVGAGFNAVRESTDKKIIAVAEKVKENYPDISEKELAQILNSDTAGIKGDFAKYGIKSDSGWVDIQSGSYATITIVIATAGVCVFGILLCVVFIRYCKKQKRQRLEIVKCLEKINNREYDLDLDGSTDDDMSLLKQEIQKTTVMLREYADNSMREKEILKNSLADISHQLKTPLTSIISYVDLLERRDDLPPEAVDYVKIISKKAVRLKNMVFDVFELAKTASGELVISKTSLSLNKLIVQTLTDMDDTVKKSGLDIKLKIPEKDVLIISDGSRMYRVMQNIMENALKYSLKGTRIYITESTENNTVKLTIKNTASYEMDFTEEEILERFVRGDKSRNTDGNGLGLSIAKEFTTACGGTFNIKIDGDQFNVIISFPIEIETDTIPEAEDI